jgi:galactose mutarotase-like enzyme
MIGSRTVEGFAALTIASEGGELEAAFVPGAGMVGCSLMHRGEELLGRRRGLRAYVAEHSTMGIPLLHPWANRLERRRFSLFGREVDLDIGSLPLSTDPNGLPIHGLLAGASAWRVERHEQADDAAALVASFDFGADAELIRAFPFPHEVKLEAVMRGSALTITTSVRATGEVPVPVSFGFHPYLRLPGLERSAWEIEVPVREGLTLDAQMLPTGSREPVTVEAGALGSRNFDNAYTAPPDSLPFVLSGGGSRRASSSATRTPRYTRRWTTTSLPSSQ